ncbi:MAG: SGNH/GDSL hydrolase family protein [Parcubacteria group bacterium]|jgi:lysophospholipase L1-like esterase
MIPIFILGSSSVYGVGAENGGWADLVKQGLHKKMYSKDGVGEKYEIYNFGKSGATIDFVASTFPQQLNDYGRGGKIITIVSIGGNNARAVGQPNNFLSTIEQYTDEMSDLLDLLRKLSSEVIFVGGGFYDEAKTCPKISPFDGGKSYFTNERKQKFESRAKQLCEEREITFVGVDTVEEEWKKKYLYRDGLHANQKGHKLISRNILSVLEKMTQK